MKRLTYEELKNSDNVIYSYIRGSNAYGLENPDGTSDIDTALVYIEPYEQLLGLGLDYQEQISDEKNDNVGYSLKKYMNMLLTSNPTALESLFIPDDCIIYEHPIMTELKKHRNKFITKKCFDSFGGYAISQIRKARGLNKKIVNPVTERKEPLDFAYTFFRQGSTKIENWLEHRGLYQKYCGLVNIPNMDMTMGVYYDWGNHFLNENVTYKDLYDAYYYTNEDDTIELIHCLKNTDKYGYSEKEKEDIKKRIEFIQLGNMARFICEFYNVNFEINSSFDKTTFEEWFDKQKPIGYKGMVGEDKLSNELRLSSVSKGEKPICYINYNKDGYSQHCREYKEYKEWEEKRNPVRYKSNLNKNYDAKNMMHSFRLLQMCIEIAKGEGFKADRRGIDREFLLDVKNHKYEYDEIIKMLEEKKEEMDKAIAESTIPDKIDENFVNDLLVDIRKKQLGLK